MHARHTFQLFRKGNSKQVSWNPLCSFEPWSNQTKNQNVFICSCLDESYYNLDYDDQPDITLDTLGYLNFAKDRIEARRIYKLNLTIFPFIMLAVGFGFGIMKFHWQFRRTRFKPKRTAKNFILGQQPEDEKELLESVKNYISEAGKKVKMLFFPFLILAFLMVVKEFLIFSITCGFSKNFLFLGLDWLASPFWPTSGFPRRVSCQIVSFRKQETFTIADYEVSSTLPPSDFLLAS